MSIRWVTWDMNTWKTYLCEKIYHLGSSVGKKIKIINWDDIRRYIISYSVELVDIHIQQKLQEICGNRIIDQATQRIDRSILWDIIFTDIAAMKIYESMIIPRMREIINTRISKYQDTVDIVLIEWAALIENNMWDIVNNNIILARCKKIKQQQRAYHTDLPEQQVTNRYNYFWSYMKKKSAIKWHMVEFDTTGNPDDSSYKVLLDSLIFNAQN